MVVGAAPSVVVSTTLETVDVCGLGISEGGVVAEASELPPRTGRSLARFHPPSLTGDFRTMVEVPLAETIVGWLGFNRRARRGRRLWYPWRPGRRH